MACVDVDLPDHPYRVEIAPGSLARLGAHVRAVAPHERAALFVDENVHQAGHGPAAKASLEAAGFDVVLERLPPGEPTKSLAVVERLYSRLAKERLERESPIVAVGGGVLGDLTGFVAATYLRGCPFVQCPTSLLAMVDSSVGGKVAVNLPEGKNLVGAFHQPRVVVIDTDVLSTLPARELRCGLAECIKHGLGLDARLFEWIERELPGILALDPGVVVELVRRNVAVKAAIVVEDERERGRRALLNLGHTFGHAIEATVGYGVYEHGEAVALGTIAACVMAEREGLVPEGLEARFRALVRRIGLPDEARGLPSDEALLECMRGDKKVQSGKLRLVLPTGVGASITTSDFAMRHLEAAWAAIRARA
jgi:3-dehydroquinate synthase